MPRQFRDPNEAYDFLINQGFTPLQIEAQRQKYTMPQPRLEDIRLRKATEPFGEGYRTVPTPALMPSRATNWLTIFNRNGLNM